MTDGLQAQRTVNRLLREPMAHFVTIGVILFFVFARFSVETESDSRYIRVTESGLLEFMQYKNQTFSQNAETRLGKMIRSMTPSQKQALIDEYVREEVLHREALSLGLDDTDYVIRRRLVQTMEYILRGTPDQDLEDPPREALQVYFSQNANRYQSSARASVAHIFFSTSLGESAAEDRAKATLLVLRSERRTVDDPFKLGDRFPYFADYTDETRELIESHLGHEVGIAAFDKPYSKFWQGPYRSRSGFHLVRVSRRFPAQMPALVSVEKIVANDWRSERAKERLEERIQSLIREYRVDTALP